MRSRIIRFRSSRRSRRGSRGGRWWSTPTGRLRCSPIVLSCTEPASDSSIAGRLGTLIDAHPHGSRVRLLGEVEEARMLALYKGCELFVLTPREDAIGRFEGLGLVYLEAAALGKPAIGTTDCGAEDAIVDDVT